MLQKKNRKERRLQRVVEPIIEDFVIIEQIIYESEFGVSDIEDLETKESELRDCEIV